MKHVYEKKGKFIESLNSPLSVLRDFEAIEYARDPISGEEYIRIRDNIGQAFYINVTGDSEEIILLELAKLLVNQRPTGFITSTSTKRTIAPMFRKAVQ